MGKRICKIISDGIDDCDRLIKRIGADEKTSYVDGECFKIKDYEVTHIVVTEHNRLNLRRHYADFRITE